MNLKIHKKIEKTNPNIKCIGSLKKDIYETRSQFSFLFFCLLFNINNKPTIIL